MLTVAIAVLVTHTRGVVEVVPHYGTPDPAADWLPLGMDLCGVGLTDDDIKALHHEVFVAQPVRVGVNDHDLRAQPDIRFHNYRVPFAYYRIKGGGHDGRVFQIQELRHEFARRKIDASERSYQYGDPWNPEPDSIDCDLYWDSLGRRVYGTGLTWADAKRLKADPDFMQRYMTFLDFEAQYEFRNTLQNIIRDNKLGGQNAAAIQAQNAHEVRKHEVEKNYYYYLIDEYMRYIAQEHRIYEDNEKLKFQRYGFTTFSEWEQRYIQDLGLIRGWIPRWIN